MSARPSERVGCVVLTRGDRPGELHRLLDSLARQRDVDVAIVVVGNGCEPQGLPEHVRVVALPDNVGVPAGRNVGADSVDGDVLLFVDDDAVLAGDDFLARAARQFDDDPRLGALQPRSADPDGAPTAARHVPRVGGRHPDRSGDVAWFWEGCSLLRRPAFEAAGCWPAAFFYGHEGIEMAWRLIDLGYRIRYDADLAVLNPAAAPFRGEQHRFMDGRNRVWVARRNLPAPVAVLYVLVWFAASVLRVRGAAQRRAVAAGFLAGLRTAAGPRRPIRWRTCVRLSALGRPPIM